MGGLRLVEVVVILALVALPVVVGVFVVLGITLARTARRQPPPEQRPGRPPSPS